MSVYTFTFQFWKIEKSKELKTWICSAPFVIQINLFDVIGALSKYSIEMNGGGY